MNYHFNVTNEKLKGRPDLKLYTGNIKTYTFSFDFDENWQGLFKFATFNLGAETYVVELHNNSLIVPHEILSSPGVCSFGIYGTNAENNIKRISSNIFEFEILQGAYSDGLTPQVPTPDIWEKLFKNSIPIIMDGYWHIYDIDEKIYKNSGIKLTPEKGIEYFTPEDISLVQSDIIKYVDNLINSAILDSWEVSI